jgi:hypothetical protein
VSEDVDSLEVETGSTSRSLPDGDGAGAAAVNALLGVGVPGVSTRSAGVEGSLDATDDVTSLA